MPCKKKYKEQQCECDCLLCRELQSLRPSASPCGDSPQCQKNKSKPNFILRRPDGSQEGYSENGGSVTIVVNNNTITKKIEDAFSYKLQDAFERGMGEDVRPGDFHRPVGDASAIVRGGGVGKDLPHYGYHPSPAKTPARDTGGGSAPALRTTSTPAAGPQNQALRCPTGSQQQPGMLRSSSKDRLVQSQVLSVPPGSASSNPSRDVRDAWDYYGPPLPSSPMRTSMGAAGMVYKTSSREVAPVQRQSPSGTQNIRGSTPMKGIITSVQGKLEAIPRVLSPPVKGDSAPVNTKPVDGTNGVSEPGHISKMDIKSQNWQPSAENIVKIEGGHSSPASKVTPSDLVHFYNMQQYPERDVSNQHIADKTYLINDKYPSCETKPFGNGLEKYHGCPSPEKFSSTSSPAISAIGSDKYPRSTSGFEILVPEKGDDEWKMKAGGYGNLIVHMSAPDIPEKPDQEDLRKLKMSYPAAIRETKPPEKPYPKPSELTGENEIKKDITSNKTIVSTEVEEENITNQRNVESTDCGSLSKSSSDGDPVISRKRAANKLKSRRRNILNFPHHLSVDELRVLQRRQDSYGGSSSDENRSSGHASMSDGHTSSSPPAETLARHDHYKSALKSVPEDERLSASVMVQSQPRGSSRRSGQNRSRHRATPAKLESGGGLEDIKMAIEQLTMRSHGSRTSYSTSTYSSMSGSESEPVRRLMRHSSLETINTNVTSADEFVWVDSHNRLVELQQLPWSNHDVLRVIQNGRIKDHMERVSMETVPRLSYLLQRALVRVAREVQRLARPLGMCSKQEVCSALKIVLSPALADSCTKACLRAAAMYTVSGDQLRQSKSARGGLQLPVGRFHRWMSDVRLGKFIHEYSAVYLTAGMENLLEEIVLQCLPNDDEAMLTATMFEHAIANNGDLWGLLQPYAHLNSGRTATGALALPRWPSTSSMEPGSRPDDISRPGSKSLEQSLLTTCVGSVGELGDVLSRVTQFHHRPTPGSNKPPPNWSPSGLHALFYFMRCSQLEHAEHGDHSTHAPIQELVYERPYIVLPPLVEWVRVAVAHADHRHSSVLDKDDVMQAARLLLPGVDCPIRIIGYEEVMCPKRQPDDLECARKLKIDLAFKMMSCGRTDLIPHALQLLPSTKVNTVNENGITPLMLSCMRGNEAMVRLLLDAGADVDMETPPNGPACSSANPETQHWTALTYATIQGHYNIVQLLLEKGANVEGGARLSEDKCTETPLQVASASGNLDMVCLLLSHGAHTFLSTLLKDSLCYSGAAQRGCYSAISVAAAHGQRAVLHKLLSHPLNSGNKEVLSLEEILAEGANQLTADRRGSRLQVVSSCNDEHSRSSMNLIGENSQILKLSKAQIKALQEAMYHSAENCYLEITLDLRNLGVPWTLHCWMHTLATAHEQRLENIIDQLLQDFLQEWPDDYSTQFVDECLPLLFTIFRYSKNEGTTLLLADIFSTCYGWESVKEIRDTILSGGTRIDPKFVNNPELSDVQFRVEGRVFYAHKIVLVTSSPRFKSMLSSKFCEGNPPIVQINDIRYDIFQMVMQYLYNGGCETLNVEQHDVLELMAAANFFQLDGLLRFCEARCSSMVDLDNIVSMYIHAKVYNAVQLLEYCQGFLLQNMVALLTYDDSVKRLLFGKKLHNHDVLAGLLLTLQARIKSRNGKPGKQK